MIKTTTLATTAVVLMCCVMVCQGMLPHGGGRTATKAQVNAKVPTPRIITYNQTLDHSNPSLNKFFAQRVLVHDEWCQSEDCPVFFYTGNEGDITMFWENTGFMFDIAPKFGAMVLFIEHRYYGKSLPFGNRSFEAGNVQYLSTEQALEDYAAILAFFKNHHNVTGPVVAFGGSYGGMLSAWMRLKFPQSIVGAIAASAPIWAFPGLCDPEEFNSIITADYVSPCSERIRDGFKLIAELSEHSAGRSTLTQAFRTCNALQTQADVDALVGVLNTAFTYMAMTDYPYPSNFLQPMPGWPVKVACSRVTSDPNPEQPEPFLRQILEAANVYYNYTGEMPCLNTSADISGGLGDAAWDYQSCTEMVLPISSDGVHDMFPPAKWDFDAFAAQCEKSWGVKPNPKWVYEYVGGKNIEYGSNIVFSNGQLDPWRYGGVNHNLSDSLIAVYIEQGAHHLDLRSSNPADPQSVIAARQVHQDNIHKWIAQWQSERAAQQ